jgi:hypothetical protein
MEVSKEELVILSVKIPSNLPRKEYNREEGCVCKKCAIRWARIRWDGILHCGMCFEKLVRKPLLEKLKKVSNG